MSLDTTAIETHSSDTRTFEPSPDFVARARLDRAGYDALYRESMDSPETFWKRETQELVFRKPWQKLLEWELPHSQWFVGAELNASESCLDRHLGTDVANKRAIIWESEPGETRTLSYAELHAEVVKLAAVLRGLGVSKGDRVAIYMGMVPEAAVAMLACARIGAIHSVIFGGFSPRSIRDRIDDSTCKAIITQDEGRRGGRPVPLKANVDEALQEPGHSIEFTVVFRHTGAKVDMSKFNFKDARTVATEILNMAPSPSMLAAIEKGIQDKEATPSLLTTLVMSSPDFQRR